MKLNFKALFFSIIGAISLLGFAFYNGYPIVYSDTSTYIVSGFKLLPPVDRPITYGLFIRLTSLNGISLWTVAFFQSLIISFLILLSIRDFAQLKKPYIYFIIVIVALSTLTVLPYVSGQIITDIFSSISIFCILHLSLNSKLKKLYSILLFSIFFIANAMHMSHLMINFLFLLCILFINKYFFKNSIKLRYKNIWILFVLTLLGILMMGASLAKSKHVFFMGRMAENGILIQFLNENCHDNEYKLCDCIDSIPTNTTDFLWDEKSPVNTKYDSWNEAQNDFGKIIRLTFLKPKYLFRHISESAKNTFKQFLAFDAGDGNGPFVGETQLYERIKEYFKFESIEYSLSKQSEGQLKREKLNTLNTIYRLIIIFSLLMLLSIFYIEKFRTQISANKKFLVFLLFTAIALNSFVNASLVIVTDRFGAKLIWLIPFVLLLIISELKINPLPSNQNSTKSNKVIED